MIVQDVLFKENCSVLNSPFGNMQYLENTGREVYVDGKKIIPKNKAYALHLVSGENVKIDFNEDAQIIINCTASEDNTVFEDVTTTVTCGGIPAGTNLKGKTLYEVIAMMLGIGINSNTIIEYIQNNRLSFYFGVEGSVLYEYGYVELNGTESYQKQGFYVFKDDADQQKAGYQITFESNSKNKAQSFAICSEAKIKTAYQYQPSLNQWLEMGFDGTYWVETEKQTVKVNDQYIEYTVYTYNTEIMGDIINSTEYWRFELEV